MKNDILIKARQYEWDKQKMKQTDKPYFHITAPVGWMNDPNGFSEYQGEYHLFYQYHPYDINWGPMHWGHYKTRDFISWEQLPAALAPDQEYDNRGCFSGSGIEHQGEHVLAYTGCMETKDESGAVQVKQVQCIASGDGENYYKWTENPVISSDMLPSGMSRTDFRDPKIWENQNKFYMAVGCCDEQKNGRIALFVSQNLKKWSFRTMLAENDGSWGRMWECPDFFALDGQYLLMASPQDMKAKGLEFHNGNNTIYIAGQFDYETCRFHQNKIRPIDYGLDFYAPQTMLTSDGRRIMIAWMQSWDTRIIPDGQEWIGMMTIPRELSLQDGRLIQQPVRELKQYYGEDVVYQKIALEGINTLPRVKGRVLNLDIEVTGGSYQSFAIHFAKNEEYKTTLRYEPESGICTFDRTYSGLCRDTVCIRQLQVFCPGSQIRLQILLDRYSAEIFINGGEQVMSSTFFTPLEAEDIEFVTTGKLEANIVKTELIMDTCGYGKK